MAAITQEEFNQMLQAAIASGLGGYYMSRWSGEEIDGSLEKLLDLNITNIMSGSYVGSGTSTRNLYFDRAAKLGIIYAYYKGEGFYFLGIAGSNQSLAVKLNSQIIYPVNMDFYPQRVQVYGDNINIAGTTYYYVFFA